MKKNIYYNNIKKIILQCGRLKQNENSLILFDKKTRNIAVDFSNIAKKITPKVELFKMKSEKVHGVEPNNLVMKKMVNSDLIICLTTMSIIHTKARKAASKKGSRYLSLPFYDREILKNKAFKTNFEKLIPVSKKIKKILDRGSYINITTEKGTNIKLSIKRRKANDAPGVCYKKGTVASPPDAEVNIAPVENAEGKIVVDGCIPIKQIGKLKENNPLTLIISNGKIVKIFGKQKRILKKVYDNQKNEKSKIIGEFGIGLNPNAKISGIMLVDEGIRGTIHFGMGLSTEGGKNNIPFHLDHVILRPNVTVDKKNIIKNGKILL